MKKHILIYGGIAGTIVTLLMLIMISYMSHCEGSLDFDTSMWLGYATMLLAFSLVFVGTRNYRNNHLNGVISFGKAFQVGILIVLTASTIYVLAWLVYYFTMKPDFMQEYGAHMMEQFKASGASPAEVEQQMKEMQEFSVMYDNPIFNGLVTYMEILPPGILVTLISSLSLRRKAA
jgi:hypothetical protein